MKRLAIAGKDYLCEMWEIHEAKLQRKSICNQRLIQKKIADNEELDPAHTERPRKPLQKHTNVNDAILKQMTKRNTVIILQRTNTSNLNLKSTNSKYI